MAGSTQFIPPEFSGGNPQAKQTAPSGSSWVPPEFSAQTKASSVPTIGTSVGNVEPFMQAPAGETDNQALHRLEPYALGIGLDSKGNKISPEDQESAKELWKNHYASDVVANGAGVSRGASNLGTGLKGAAVDAGEATAGFLEHPVDSIESGLSKAGDALAAPIVHPFNTAQGIGTGIVDVAHGAVNLGAGAFEDSQAAASYHNPSNARFAADVAMARLEANNQVNSAIEPTNPGPGFGVGRLAGQVAGAEATAPGAIGGALKKAGNIGEAVVPPVVSASGQVLAAPFKAAGGLLNMAGKAIPGARQLGQVGSAIADSTSTARAAASATDAAALVRANTALQDVPALRSVALQRAATAEQAVDDATAAGTPAAGLSPLLKEVQDAHQELAQLNLGEAMSKHIVSTAAAAALPSRTEKVLSALGQISGKTALGAGAGTAYEGLTGNPGDSNAATQGFVAGGTAGALAGLSGEAAATNLGKSVTSGATNLGNGALRAVSNGYLQSIGYLKAAGTAYGKAQAYVASKLMPSELPENDNLIFPHTQAVQMAQDELAGKTAPSEASAKTSATSGQSKPPFEPAGSVEGLGGKKLPVWNTNEPVGEHPEGSTVTRQTLESHGLEVPPHPDETGSPLAAPKAPPQAGPTISVDPPTDHPAPTTYPSAREVKALAGATVPVSNEGDVPFSPKLPGQHEKINFLKRQLPTEFNPATHGIQGAGPSDEDIYKLAGGMAPANSTKITGISYDPAKQLLGVGMNDGKFYVHENVPDDLHAHLMQEANLASTQKALPKPQQTASVGKLYNSVIRGNPDYKYITIRTPLLDETGAPLPAIKAAAEQIKAHDMRQSSLQSALENGYDTPENIAQRSAAEQQEHDTKLKGILAGSKEGPLSPPKPKSPRGRPPKPPILP